MILYTIGVSLLAYVPFIGLPLAAVLIPFGTLGLTLAGRDAERGKIPMPSLMVEPFRDPQQRKALALLGCINAALVLLLVTLVSLLAADELARWKFVDGQIDPVSAGQNFPWDAVIAAALVYVPILMVTWFAPQLVAWHDVSDRQGVVLLVLHVLAQPLALLGACSGVVCVFVDRDFHRHSTSADIRCVTPIGVDAVRSDGTDTGQHWVRNAVSDLSQPDRNSGVIHLRRNWGTLPL